MSTHEEIRVGQLAIRYLIDGPSSGGSIAMFEFDVAPGAKVPIAHSHDAYEETIYGLHGILTFTVEGKKTELGPGQTICIPRGAIHRFDNLHPTVAKTLVVITPGILGPDYFREIAAILRTAAIAGTPPDPAAIGTIMHRHGLTPAP